MANDYYLEGEQLEEQLDEEAHFYFMLNDFSQCVDKYGAEFVIKRMRNNTFEKLSEWFYFHDEKSHAQVCELLKKKMNANKL